MKNKYSLKIFQKFDHIITGFSNKSDGNMSFKWGPTQEVINNRQQFLHKLNIKLDDSVMMTVQHETNIKIIDSSDLSLGMHDIDSAIPVDAIITNQKNITLCLQTADCLPILFYDPSKQVIALGHMGWQGTDKKLSQKIIQTMIEKFSCAPRNIFVGIGPGIHKETYIFSSPVNQENNLNWQPYLTKLPDTQISIDIIDYNQDQLLANGILKDNIDISPVDTFKDPNFYSHYRSQRAGEPEGRFMTIIKLS